jgi:hypothetical protein
MEVSTVWPRRIELEKKKLERKKRNKEQPGNLRIIPSGKAGRSGL